MALFGISQKLFDDVVGDLRLQLAREQERADSLERKLYDILNPRNQKIARAAKKVVENRTDKLINEALMANHRTRNDEVGRARLRGWADRQIEGGRPLDEVLDDLRGWATVTDDDEDETIGI